jgi:hypothetical protein
MTSCSRGVNPWQDHETNLNESLLKCNYARRKTNYQKLKVNPWQDYEANLNESLK